MPNLGTQDYVKTILFRLLCSLAAAKLYVCKHTLLPNHSLANLRGIEAVNPKLKKKPLLEALLLQVGQSGAPHRLL